MRFVNDDAVVSINLGRDAHKSFRKNSDSPLLIAALKKFWRKRGALSKNEIKKKALIFKCL